MRSVIGRVSTSAAALLAAALLGLPQAASAQSLGEAAEKAKKERKGGSKTKVITDTELRQAGAGRPEAPVTSSETATEAAPAAPAEGAAPGTAVPAKAEKTEDELRAEAEAKWRDRVKKAQEEVGRLNTEANTLQTNLNDLSQNLYGSNRTATMNRLDEVKKQLAVAQQSVADLEEEGRRSRFRP
jgi:chromosome segregation ATPase